MLQVLGRSLEALITSAEARQTLWKDSFTSVEHLILAADEDPHFGRDLLRRHNVTTDAIEAAIKEIRGSNRVFGAVPDFESLIRCRLPLASLTFLGACNQSNTHAAPARYR